MTFFLFLLPQENDVTVYGQTDVVFTFSGSRTKFQVSSILYYSQAYPPLPRDFQKIPTQVGLIFLFVLKT